MIYAYFTLFVALVISCVAEYYSIIGLTTLFSAAFWPVVIMGASLAVGKITAAVWLKINWDRAPLIYKLYLVPAVIFLMILTSIGCFGFLSKAHSDQNLISGDVGAKIAIYDEKIKTSKENIEANRKALKQMDEAVDQMMGRSTDEKGADKAVAVRRSQAKERARLQQEIITEQSTIAKLNEEAAPIRAEVRQVENETGPLKYIAALIYGDNPDANILEKAVRFVIIMIVAVFDPLALVLILAAQQSMRWEKEEEERQEQEKMDDVEDFFKRARETAQQLDREAAEQADEGTSQLTEDTQGDTSSEISGDSKDDVEVERPLAEQHPYLNEPFVHFKDLKPMVAQPEAVQEPVAEPEIKQEITVDSTVTIEAVEPEIQTSNVTIERVMYDPNTVGYINFEGKQTSIESLKTSHPHLILPSDGRVPNKFNFGGEFPREALVGDLYMRTDARPHRLFKFNGMEWIHVNKEMNTSYLQYDEYIQFLIDSLNGNQYLPEMLTDSEDEEIRYYLEK